MASFWYDEGFDQLCRGKDGAATFSSDTIKVLLLTTTAATTTYATVSALLAGTPVETTVTGATSSDRQTLSNKAYAESGGTVTFDADDLTWTSVAAGETIVAAVVYRHVTNDTDSVPLWHIETNDLATDGNNVNLAIHASGLATVS